MDILIDTQILIWSLDIQSPLSNTHKEILQNPSNRILFSQISLMELAIKKNINKLPGLVASMETIVETVSALGFELLKLTNEQIFSYQTLPVFENHKDPFDRFLIAIAKQENLAIMTSDLKFRLYSDLIKTII